MIKQKGQSTVEFALILPLFFMLVFGTIYGGMMFYDAWKFQSIADNMAREAMFKVDSNTLKLPESDEENIIKRYKIEEFTAYKLKLKKIKIDDDNNTVTATIELELKEDIPKIVSSLMPTKLTFKSSMPIMQ